MWNMLFLFGSVISRMDRMIYVSIYICTIGGPLLVHPILVCEFNFLSLQYKSHLLYTCMHKRVSVSFSFCHSAHVHASHAFACVCEGACLEWPAFLSRNCFVCALQRERDCKREKKGKRDINISWSVCSPGSLDICQGQGTTGKIVIEEIREQKTQWKSKKGNKLENIVDVSKRWELEKKRIYIYGETDRLKRQTWSSLATLSSKMNPSSLLFYLQLILISFSLSTFYLFFSSLVSFSVFLFFSSLHRKSSQEL